MTPTGCSSATASPEVVAGPAVPRVEAPVRPWLGEVDSIERDGPRYVLTPETWLALVGYLDAWAQYPDQCQGAIDDQAGAWRVAVVADQELARARAIEAALGAAGDYSWHPWEVALLTVLVGASGALVGFGLGALAH